MRGRVIEGRVRPLLRELAPQQLAGLACLWCADELGGDAVDLPAQTLRPGPAPARTPVLWLPRSCPGCAAPGGAAPGR